MKLATMTWKEVSVASRECAVLIPTGSLEQHGPALPLMTDSFIVSAVAERVEERLGDKVLLLPTLWLGVSPHHMAFAGTLTASAHGYEDSVTQCVCSLVKAGFWKFYVLNGHGGNNHANGLLLRKLKTEHPTLALCHAEYYDLIQSETALILTGADRKMTHAAEAEASLMLHLAPELVKTDLLRDDGLHPSPALLGLVTDFHEITEEGSFGAATEASAEKGEALFMAAVDNISQQVEVLADGFVFTSAKE